MITLLMFYRLFLILTLVILLPNLSAEPGKNGSKERPSILLTLDTTPRSELIHYNTPRPEKKSKAIEKLATYIDQLPPSDIPILGKDILQPRANKFVPPYVLDTLVRELSYPEEEGDYSAFSKALSQQLAHYVDYHWQHRDRTNENKNKALYYHLLFITQRFQPWLLNDVKLKETWPDPVRKSPLKPKIRIVRGPEKDPGFTDIVWNADQPLIVGKHLYLANASGSYCFNAESGKITKTPPPKTSQKPGDFRIITSYHDTIYGADSQQCYFKKQHGIEWITTGAFHKEPTVYHSFTATSNSLCSYFSPPPHYYGAIENDPGILISKPRLMFTKLHVWNSEKKTSIEISANKSFPFIGQHGMRYSCYGNTTTASGKLALGLFDRDSEYGPNPKPSDVYIANSNNVADGLTSRLQHHGKASIQPGFSDDEILFTSLAKEVSPYDGGFIPNFCVVYDNKSHSIRQLFHRCQPYETDQWPLLNFKQPDTSAWQLPKEFKSPHPGVQTAWHRLFVKENKLIAYVSQWRVGRENSPVFSLLVFKPGRKMATKIPLKFEINRTIKKRLSEGGYVGHIPTPEHRILPEIHDCGTLFTFTSFYAIWTLEWKTVQARIENHP